MMLSRKRSHRKNTQKSRKIKTIQFFYFNANFCPHCVHSKPDWERFRAKFNNVEINRNKIECVNVETTIENSYNKKLIKKYKVEGIPLVICLIGSKKTTLEKKITYMNLESFLKRMIGSTSKAP